MPVQTQERIKKIRVDAIYGKKKHFNAADRKRSYQQYVSVTVIVVNVILGSALFLYAKVAIPEEMKWIGGCLALCSAALTALQSYFSWPKMVQGHCKIGARYLSLAKNCSNTLAQKADGLISDAQLVKQLELLTKELSKVDESANAYPTSKADYRASQHGLSGGEENYSELEINAGE
ncbi:MAG: SLATT domain-containing protein [Verrucomicrobiia bacterium]|jgi:hypothetical protein